MPDTPTTSATPGQPAVPDSAGGPEDLLLLARESAEEARLFVATLSDVASGAEPGAALPVTLLALSQVLVMGARLGAIEDVVPEERFEPDDGPDAELDPLRASLDNLFTGLDEYADVVDPVLDPQLTPGSLASDLTVVASALTNGLRHYDAGHRIEALWWWQFSYLADWGERAAMALRVLQTVLAHVRLDADPDVVAEAEFDALHP